MFSSSLFVTFTCYDLIPSRNRGASTLHPKVVLTNPPKWTMMADQRWVRMVNGLWQQLMFEISTDSLLSWISTLWSLWQAGNRESSWRKPSAAPATPWLPWLVYPLGNLVINYPGWIPVTTGRSHASALARHPRNGTGAVIASPGPCPALPLGGEIARDDDG